MSFTAIGDMAQQFQMQRQNHTLKTGLNRASNELSTGKIADVTSRLRGDTMRLSGINHSVSILESYAEAGREVGVTLGAMQTMLNGFDAKRDSMARDLLLVSDETSTPILNEATRKAKVGFSELVTIMNGQFANRSLFSGNSVDGPALSSGEDMLAALVTAVGGASDELSIISAVDTWFDTPGGGFETVGYLGDTGAKSARRLSETTTISIEARADDPAIRETLKAAAISALAGELIGLDRQTQGKLAFAGAVGLQSAATGLAQTQGSIGFAEAEVERVSTQTSAQLTSLNLSRNEFILADPFETATQLQAIQLQLETHYTVTARMSQLSLLGYLR